jgi:murein DD-endopeptidase MepM/ murein hydrolase activator NlpD
MAIDAVGAAPNEGGRPTEVGMSGRPRDRAAERAQLKVLAQEFEALLMNDMLSGWRASLASSDQEEAAGDGMSTMVDMVGAEFGRALSRAGGLGVAAQLLKAFDRQSEPPRPPGPPPGSPLVQVAAAARPALDAGMRPLDRTVTSGFGWRRDPIGGAVKFHAGTDLRMAYGEEVASVAAGRVSFAGERGGYGLLVIVDHEDGLQTRFAHLSTALVGPGDVVAPGQPIARAGTSGRTTGPHLHVELLRHGRPIDPSTLLKGVKGNADWGRYRSASSERVHQSAVGDQE